LHKGRFYTLLRATRVPGLPTRRCSPS
jgi:hypothetical protein